MPGGVSGRILSGIDRKLRKFSGLRVKWVQVLLTGTAIPIMRSNRNHALARPAGARALPLLLRAALWLPVAAPANGILTDAFAVRPLATGNSAAFSGNSTSASRELDEPEHDASNSRSVWAAWTAPGNGDVTIDTFGSSFNTVLSIYTGSSIASLRPVARNRNAPGSTQSRVVFPVKAGTTYSIAVDGEVSSASGYGTAAVQVSFQSYSQPGAEVGTDDFASRPLLAGGSALGVASNRYFTLDALEPEPVSIARKNAWWRWIAPGDGEVVIDTLDSGFDTVLAVFTGGSVTSLHPVAVSYDTSSSNRSQLGFQTRRGQEYQVMVDGGISNADGYGNILLALDWTANSLPGAVTGADSFAQRGVLEGANAEGVSMNQQFGTEAYEPDHGSTMDRSAWWEWTAPANGRVRIRTEGSSFNTLLAVYGGGTLQGLQPLAANNNVSGALWSEVSFMAERGKAYQIAVDGGISNASGYGNIRLRVDQAAVPGDILAIYPAVELEIPGVKDVRYQLQWSPNLIDWHDTGAVITGGGAPVRWFDSVRGVARKYYRYRIIP